MDSDLKSQVDQACKTAEDFTKHFYESMDKRRHLTMRMYLDNGVLVWNGNGTNGKEGIGQFLMELPASEHSLQTLDVQRIIDAVVSNKVAYLIKATGNVKYQGKLPRTFSQTFIITTQDDKWKIVSDCFRFQEPIP